MKNPVDIAVTGAAGQICYSLLFRLASGALLGPDQPISLRLLEIPQAMDALQGVVMELNDCAFPLLKKVVTTSDPKLAFDNVDFAFLIGSRPRGPGMERSELLASNAEIFTKQGRALNEVARRNVKILVTGNPANTNALIAQKNAPDLGPECFTAMTMLDHNRAVGLLAEKCGVSCTDIKHVTIWGNHSATQYPDLNHAKVKGQNALGLVDEKWFVDEFIPTVQQRGASIIKARGLSSAASAANAAIDQMKAWHEGTPEGDWVSMGIRSDGSYGIESGLIFSFPVVVKDGEITIVQNLEINKFSQERLKLTETELKEEAAAIKHLL